MSSLDEFILTVIDNVDPAAARKAIATVAAFTEEQADAHHVPAQVVNDCRVMTAAIQQKAGDTDQPHPMHRWAPLSYGTRKRILAKAFLSHHYDFADAHKLEWHKFSPWQQQKMLPHLP